MKLRTFIAVALPDDLRARAANVARRLAAIAPNVKWVGPQSLHWTLQFLGNVDEREIAEVCAAVAEAALAHEPFELEIRGVGAFPSTERPRTLWIGTGQPVLSIVFRRRR